MTLPELEGIKSECKIERDCGDEQCDPRATEHASDPGGRRSIELAP